MFSRILPLRAAGVFLAGVVMLATPVESQAFFGWLRGLCNRCKGIYTPPVPTACAPVPTTVQYIPQTCFRPIVVDVPVTTFRPVVTGCDPCTGAVVTCMRPETVMQKQVRQVPYTTYRLVYSTPVVAQPVATVVAPTCGAPAVAAAPAVGCTSCASAATYASPITAARVESPAAVVESQAHSAASPYTPPYYAAPAQPSSGAAASQPVYGAPPGQPVYGVAPSQPVDGSATAQPAGDAAAQGGYPTAPGQADASAPRQYADPLSGSGSVGQPTPRPALRPETKPEASRDSALPREPQKTPAAPEIRTIPDESTSKHPVDPASGPALTDPDNRTAGFRADRQASFSTVSRTIEPGGTPAPRSFSPRPIPSGRPAVDDSGWRARPADAR